MTKANRDKVKKAFADAKGRRVRVETLLPVKWKKKLVPSIQRKAGP